MEIGDNHKKALVIRYGAFGDQIMATPVLKLLKRNGYHVTFNVSERGYDVVKHDPNVDKFLIHKEDSVPASELDRYWEEISKGYDKVINFSESIERSLLKLKGDPEWNFSKFELDKRCNDNYFDRHLEIAGFEERGVRPELYFTGEEESFGRRYRKKYRKNFLILWSLSGSAHHKGYPYTEEVAKALLNRFPDIMILTVGDSFCQLLEWNHPRTKSYSSIWGIRKTMLMTKYVDMVVGTETGVLNAASCFKTPKIILMSHSSDDNLVKYWENVYPIRANVPCTPCHKLHYSLETCEHDPFLLSPVCMAKLEPGYVFKTIADVYIKEKEKRNGILYRNGSEAVLCR